MRQHKVHNKPAMEVSTEYVCWRAMGLWTCGNGALELLLLLPLGQVLKPRIFR